MVKWQQAADKLYWLSASLMRAVAQSLQSPLQIRLWEPAAADHHTDLLGYVIDILKRIRIEQQQIWTPTKSHRSKFGFLMKEGCGESSRLQVSSEESSLLANCPEVGRPHFAY